MIRFNQLKKIKFTFNTFLKIICIFGCLVQIYEINQIYFSYETVTDVRYEFDRIKSLPAITICVPKHQLFTKHEWTKLRNQKLESNPLKYLNKLNISQQFKVTGHPIMKCNVINTLRFSDSAHYIDCSRIRPIRTYLTYETKCFTLFSQFINESIDNYIINENLGLENFIHILNIVLPAGLRFVDIFFVQKPIFVVKDKLIKDILRIY
jgi:hypothetical protein